MADLLLLQRPVAHRRAGHSAWLSYWRGEDEGLWAPPGGAGSPLASEPGEHR